MTRPLELTEGQRMALVSIVGAYVRLALWQQTNVPPGRVESLPVEFYNAGDDTSCTAEDLLAKLLER